MDKLDRIALFGGAFDPVHNAHLEIANLAKEKFQLDQVHFILAKDPPHKQPKLDAQSRFEILEELLAGREDFIASRIELDREGTSFSYLTVEDYKQLYPQAELFWIMGYDAWQKIDSWKNFEYLKDNLNFILCARSGLELEHDNSLLYIDGLDLQESSTLIRQLIANNKYEELGQLVPDKIKALILEHYSRLFV